ncbi:unnamed protein product [Didymodactylos carnosus]|uniref:Uncharacterized protein n=1 Tax=Didymodactylos carnosus TaxID=1234261 RepID=A0A814RMJ6_9BILA|nr:unnamed protein product [Didymodactylos carnosus]CAF1134589.1 unnamed protein product [Didymodactylos carnosus]CAF3505440.1 unnamed protein product [Didymodactylos carnosus]CAF3898329.1 unnamed protein product [Didymodactylos carnosus]
MAYYQKNEYDFRRYGNSVNVPNNDIARCMYYLNCVCHTIEYNENNIQRYCNYENWRQLSDAEDYLVFVLCLTLSPDEFEDKCFVESPELCGSSSNAFYEVGQIKHSLLAVQSVVIAGRTRHVNKIMAYTQSWMKSYYYEPMSRLVARYRPQQPSTSSSAPGCVIS